MSNDQNSNNSNNNNNKQDPSLANKQLSKADQDKRRAERTNTIKELAKTPMSQLDQKESQLWSEKQRFFDEKLPQVAQLKRTMRILKDDLNKYGKVGDQYQAICDEYNRATQEAQKREEDLNLQIQNVQAAKTVQVEAKNIPAQNQQQDDAIKAAIEGQKPFTPQITPDQSFSLAAATQAYHNETAQQPEQSGTNQVNKTQQQQQTSSTNTQTNTQTGQNIVKKGNQVNEQTDSTVKLP